MESYRHENTDKYCAVIYRNNKNDKLSICYNIHDEKFIREYWANTEEPNYSIVEVKPITNVTALKYFQYWQIIPKAEKEDYELPSLNDGIIAETHMRYMRDENYNVAHEYED